MGLFYQRYTVVLSLLSHFVTICVYTFINVEIKEEKIGDVPVTEMPLTNAAAKYVAKILSLVTTLLGPGSGFRLLVLHTNDMHAHYAQTDQMGMPCTDHSPHQSCFGGFPRLLAAVRQERKWAEEDPLVDGSLFLNAGDTFQGTSFYTQLKWKAAAELLPKLGIDVMTLGIHEFDDGINDVVKFIETSKIPVVVSNIDLSKVPLLATSKNLMKSIVLEIKGVIIGIVGYMTPETMAFGSTGKLRITDEIDSVRAEAKHLKDDGVDLVIALGHSGYEMDKKIASEVEEIDAVVGGRSHSFLYNGFPPNFETTSGPYPTYVYQPGTDRSIPVVQAYHSTKYLGRFYLEFNDKRQIVETYVDPILLDSSIPQDVEMLGCVKKYIEEIEPYDNQVIGTTSVYLEGCSGEVDCVCSIRECNSADFILDSYVDYNAEIIKKEHDYTKFWTDAPIAMVHSSAIQSGIDPGAITNGQLSVVIPFNDIMGKVIMHGSNIKKAIEHAFHRYDANTANEEFLQVSGLRIIVDISLPAGNRVQSILVKSCERGVEYTELNPNDYYVVILSKYLLDGGGGHEFGILSEFVNCGKTLLDVAKKSIQSKSSISPGRDRRIQINNNTIDLYPIHMHKKDSSETELSEVGLSDTEFSDFESYFDS